MTLDPFFELAAIAIYSVVAGEFIYRLNLDKPLRGRKATETEKEHESASPGLEDDGENGLPNHHGVAGHGHHERIPGNVRLVFLGLAISTLFLLIRAIYRLIEVSSTHLIRRIGYVVYHFTHPTLTD